MHPLDHVALRHGPRGKSSKICHVRSVAYTTRNSDRLSERHPSAYFPASPLLEQRHSSNEWLNNADMLDAYRYTASKFNNLENGEDPRKLEWVMTSIATEGSRWIASTYSGGDEDHWV